MRTPGGEALPKWTDWRRQRSSNGCGVAANGGAVNDRCNVYFSEFDASRIRRIDAATGRITTVAR